MQYGLGHSDRQAGGYRRGSCQHGQSELRDQEAERDADRSAGDAEQHALLQALPEHDGVSRLLREVALLEPRFLQCSKAPLNHHRFRSRSTMCNLCRLCQPGNPSGLSF